MRFAEAHPVPVDCARTSNGAASDKAKATTLKITGRIFERAVSSMRVTNLLIAISALGISLACAELIVRFLGLAPQVQVVEFYNGAYRTTDNPNLPYVPNPSRGMFNSIGLRDREHAEDPTSAPRIVVIGDSVMFGGMLPVEQIFTTRLELWIHQLQPGSQAVVYNLGVPGYDTRHEVEYLKLRGLALAPSEVIVAYCLNDTQVASSELSDLLSNPRYTQQADLIQALSRNALLQSHLLRLAAFRLQDSPLRRLFGTPERDPAALQAQGRARVEKALSELAALGTEHNFKVRVVIFPYLLPYRAYPANDEHRFIRGAALAHGFAVLDLLEIFSGTVGDDVAKLKLIPEDFIHMNAFAHELAARSVAPAVIQDLGR